MVDDHRDGTRVLEYQGVAASFQCRRNDGHAPVAHTSLFEGYIRGGSVNCGTHVASFVAVAVAYKYVVVASFGKFQLMA